MQGPRKSLNVVGQGSMSFSIRESYLNFLGSSTSDRKLGKDFLESQLKPNLGRKINSTSRQNIAPP